MNQVVKKLIDLCVEGAKVLDICVEGDKLLEEGTGAVYNKAIKGVKVQKGEHRSYQLAESSLMLEGNRRHRLSYKYIRQQLRGSLFTVGVRLFEG